MRLRDIFRTPGTVRLLDFLYENPTKTFTQAMLAVRLKVDKATVRRAVNRLAALGIVDVDLPHGVGMKVVTLNAESPVGQALQTFHRTIREIQADDLILNKLVSKYDLAERTNCLERIGNVLIGRSSKFLSWST